MKIFCHGQAGSGLSPFSNEVGAALSLPVISIDSWRRSVAPNIPDKGKQFLINEYTNVNVLEVKKDPFCFVNYVKSKNHTNCIIEGVRSIFDFIHLFNPKEDVVVFLNRLETPYKTNTYETGVLQINEYVDWMCTLGFMDKEKRVSYVYNINELSQVVDNFLKLMEYRNWCLTCGASQCRHK